MNTTAPTGGLDDAIALLQQWAQQNAITLKEQKKTSYNIYYHAVKAYEGKEMTAHVVASTLPEDPGYVHVSFRSYDKPDKRKGIEEDITRAEAILWADGRKADQ